MSDLFPITLFEQLAEVEREIALRKRVYPQWVKTGRLKQDKAEKQIAAMEAVARTLNRLVGEKAGHG